MSLIERQKPFWTKLRDMRTIRGPDISFTPVIDTTTHSGSCFILTTAVGALGKIDALSMKLPLQPNDS